MSGVMIPQLERPARPALPNSYFWTWDHSTNWVLDDPGLVNFGCSNRYTKRARTYLEDYRCLTDLAGRLGVCGIVVWGFLRESHGGVEFARRVADYGASRGVDILPGIGTTWYGGIYYEGNHRYNLDTFLARNPDACMVDQKGRPREQGGRRGACPSHPAYVEWLQEGVQWLFDEFNIGGANLENGDFLVCHDPRCRAHRERWPESDPDFFRLQAMSYVPALEAVKSRLHEKLVTWATYTGFVPGDATQGYVTAHMQCRRPEVAVRVPDESVGQWTLTGMVRQEPLPLTAFLEEGEPAAVFDNPLWPKDLRPPGRRAVGFLHHGSQWWRGSRYAQVLSTIKEACLRAWKAGMEGVSIHGEVTDRHVPAALNYLAFSHFIHRPEDTLVEFGRETLGQVLGHPDRGEAYVRILAHRDGGTLTEDHGREAGAREKKLRREVAAEGTVLLQWRFWHWLASACADRPACFF